MFKYYEYLNRRSHNGVTLFLIDNLHHQFIDSLDHVLAVALQAGLHAGIVEELPDNQAGLFGGVLSKFVEVDHELIGLVELESDVPQLRPRLACLGLFLHEGAHEGHLAHARSDGRDDQGWSQELLA